MSADIYKGKIPDPMEGIDPMITYGVNELTMYFLMKNYTLEEMRQIVRSFEETISKDFHVGD